MKWINIIINNELYNRPHMNNVNVSGSDLSRRDSLVFVVFWTFPM